MSVSDYEAFLATKRLDAPCRGRAVEADALNPNLFPFQRQLVRWALRKGRAALFAGTGLGKTLMSLSWAEQAAERVLILAPLAVARQTVREGEKFGVTVTYARSQEQAPAEGITITNYEMLDRFRPDTFPAVVLDECFPAGTLVDTPYGRLPIEDIRPGDAIWNASGIDTVTAVARREVKRAVRVSVAGDDIISSPNHPYLTRRGWIRAVDLSPGDYLMATATAMRLVRRGFHAEVSCPEVPAFLREILLCEMADEPPRLRGDAAHTGDCGEAGREETRVVCGGVAGGPSPTGSNCGAQSIHSARGEREDIRTAEGHRLVAGSSGRKRTRVDRSSIDSAVGARERMAAGIRRVSGSPNQRLSYLLQSRSGEFQPADSHRSGRLFPFVAEWVGPEEGSQASFARVDGVAVLEPGHPELERLRDAGGSLYFYDIEAARHPSFSVNHHVVHNSSILKAYDGKTKAALIAAFRQTPLRLCCTATPAPNDIQEIANHAEFLGVMTRPEMLASFFVNDEKAGWRLKGHATEPFYRWLASWGMSLNRPSDLGYSDEGYVLPPLIVKPVFVETDYQPEGQLFTLGLHGVAERAAVRRDTAAARTEAAAVLIEREPEEPWLVWCGINDEANRMAKAIPGAVNVEGAASADDKAAALSEFAEGRIRVLVTKPGIAAHGMNFQHCARMLFVGMNDSFEQYYQALRRCWRYGQQRAVNAYAVLAEPERCVYENVLRKEREAAAMSEQLVRHVADFERSELAVQSAAKSYDPLVEMTLPDWMEDNR